MDEEAAFNDAGPSTQPAALSGVECDAPLSKNAQKRLAKKARFQEHKLEKRAVERERRRERRKELSKGYAAGTLTPAELAQVERTRELKRARRAADKGTETDVWPGAIVIDLGFDALMTDGEITSMASQLTYVYSSNRTAKRPVSAVLHTSLSPAASPRLWEHMAKAHWHRWARMHFWAGGVDELARVMRTDSVDGAGEAPTTPQPPPPPPNPAADVPTPASLSDPHLPFPASRQLVYLSADADEELTTLSEDEVYIIGGIVDRNRHKGLCQGKAEELGIRTARLPIGTFIDNLPTRKVLTVNQVYDILLQYLALGDWAAAFETVIPSRKYFGGREEKKKANRRDEASAGSPQSSAVAAGDMGSESPEGTSCATGPADVTSAVEPMDEESAMNS